MKTLGYAILGLLAQEELSGYDLMQRMKGRVGNFWSAGHSQIYPELARLEADGLVTHSVVKQQERPDKKVYETTPEGLKILREWVTEPPPANAPKDELVLKAYSVWLADPEKAAKLFRDEETKHKEQLSRYKETRSWMEHESGGDVLRPESPWFAGYAALRRGLIYEKGYVEWCRWVADSVEGKQDDPPKRKKKKKGKKKGE